MYIGCPLKGLKSKSILMKKLNIPNKKYLNINNIQSKIHPYIDHKKRLVEAPENDLKKIQRKIKNLLTKCDIPCYMFSGIKNRSYVGNARIHLGKKYTYKVDISSFFPNTSRDKIYKFFLYDLYTSQDVAKILTDLLTYNIKNTQNKDILEFINLKKIKCFNHLITGSPASPLLSYLVNREMFDELNSLSKKNNITLTIYMDDCIFSSYYPISFPIREKIKKIIKKNGYQISKKKLQYCSKNFSKIITGVIINKNGQLAIPNKISNKIINLFHTNDNNKNNMILKGYVNCARQIEKNSFQNIKKIIG